MTARKRTERLQDVPVAITAFTSDQLARYATQSLSQIAAQTPDLQVGPQAGVGENVITLRGIGTVSSSTTNDQSVALNIDGVQVSQSSALALGLHDLGRIEILKGPQALFYGKNSPAGVISLVSQDPGHDLEVMARGGYEFAADQRFVEGTVSGPLTSTIGARIDGYYSKQDGWFRNDAKPIAPIRVPPSAGGTGESTSQNIGSSLPRGSRVREYFTRGTLAYASPDQAFDAKLKISYDNITQRGGYGFLNQIEACAGPAPQYVLLLNSSGSRDCKVNRYNNQADLSSDVSSLYPKIFKNGRLYTFNKQFLASLATDYHPSDALTLTSVTGYYNLKSGIDGNFAYGDQDFIAAGSYLNTKQFSEELRATTKLSGPINFMVGAYYQHVNLRDLSAVAVGNPLSKAYTGGFLSGPVLLVDPRLGQITNAYSAFGQVLYNITSTLQITAGARYSHEAKKVSGHENPNSFTATGYDILFSPRQRSFNNVSPEATLTYKPVRSLTLYAAYRQGFKSGGFDLNSLVGGFGRINAGDTTYKQETARGGEIGAKGTLADRQIAFDIAVFNYKYDGLQISAFNPTSLSYQFTNAGSATTKGVEASIQLQPDQVRGLSLRGTIDYDKARFDRFTNSPCYTGQSQAAGCSSIAGRGADGNVTITPATPTAVGNAQDLSGRPLARAPNWSGNVGATYEREIGGGLTASISSDALYTGSYLSLPEEDPRSRVHEAWRYNASIRVRGRNDKWALALIGTNLTNVLRSVSSAAVAGSGGKTGTSGAFLGDLIGSVSEPRAVTLQATLKY
ncbi:TonB-dependent receptor [Sphingomonas sp.]|uniref:TonB-dependent receptor n=1 Tax=Sphingomonas sp. TaxID=28214 RepID=UPI003B005E80